MPLGYPSGLRAQWGLKTHPNPPTAPTYEAPPAARDEKPKCLDLVRTAEITGQTLNNAVAADLRAIHTRMHALTTLSADRFDLVESRLQNIEVVLRNFLYWTDDNLSSNVKPSDLVLAALNHLKKLNLLHNSRLHNNTLTFCQRARRNFPCDLKLEEAFMLIFNVFFWTISSVSEFLHSGMLAPIDLARFSPLEKPSRTGR
uniref:Uncharacterized protein n=1 Tax=Caenorhabditis japonica TaxID=281687 RepID=A0A8R1E430_CAEJA